MKGTCFKPLTIVFLLAWALNVQGQQYSNNLEFNIYDFPWFNVHPSIDTTFGTENHVSLCNSLIEYGFGFELPIPESLLGKNLHLRYEADFRFPDTIGQGDLVLTILRDGNTLYWQSYALSPYANDSAQWFHTAIETQIPFDYLTHSTLKSFIWNPNKSLIHIDNAQLELSTFETPSYLPSMTLAPEPRPDGMQLRLLGDTLPLSGPIFLLNEYVLDHDTITEFTPFILHEQALATSSIGTTRLTILQSQYVKELRHTLHSTFTKDCHLLRQAFVIPFTDPIQTVYRRNFKADSVMLQTEYYLDREGFTIGEGPRSVSCYHPTGISSMQLDTKNRTVFFNVDYWRDHPMIHYPLNDTLEDHFEDISYRDIQAGDTLTSSFNLCIGADAKDLPRIIPIPDGYESGIIFTEHADWTDLRTHRAVCFGNEHITRAKDATGGFVHYGIPVTKSVFYNNPDGITNQEASHGAFPGLQATLRTDKEFKQLLDQLDDAGFEICLHTPEQYTSTASNLKEALAYMKRHYRSASWIDHGYNNGSRNNREDLVCDGINPESDLYAGALWQQYGIRYLWNAYYEENRMEAWCFDNNLMQPYLGFGDALPNRQITTLPYPLSTLHSPLSTFLAWSTPSTLDANSDDDWDFYYHPNRLQRIVESHSVHITHTYPAWTNPARAFWTYNDEGDIVALPGMNRALKRIADLKAQGKMLPMTVKTYLDHYTALLQVEYHIIDAHTIILVNKGKRINGLTLLCPAPFFPENKYYHIKETPEGSMIWFDLRNKETVTLKIR